MKLFLVIAIFFSVTSIVLLVESFRRKWEWLYAKALLLASILAVLGWIMYFVS